MDRTLAVGATSGSLSALIFRLVTGVLNPSIPPPPFECPVCPELPNVLLLGAWEIEPYSCGLGLLIGLCIGPNIGVPLPFAANLEGLVGIQAGEAIGEAWVFVPSWMSSAAPATNGSPVSTLEQEVEVFATRGVRPVRSGARA